MRAGVFVPAVPSLGWQKMFVGVLGALTRFWGGSQSLVFPLQDDLMDHELFWALADRLDADRYLVYSGAIADLEYLAPDEYVASHGRERERVASYTEEAVRSYMEQWRAQWIVEGTVPAGLHEHLIRRVAPLHADAALDVTPFGGMEEPPYPFSDVGKLAELPQPIVNVGTGLGDAERLLLATEVGLMPPGLRQRLDDRHIAIQDEVVDNRSAWHELVFQRARRRSGTYPARLTELGLEWSRRRWPGNQAVPLIVGDDPWDFTLFYALRRWHSVAYWLPRYLLDSKEFCRRVLLDLRWMGAPTLSVLSASDPDLREPARERLAQYYGVISGAHTPSLNLQIGEWRDFLADEPYRLFERDNRGFPQPLLIVDDTTPPLPTPIPRQIVAEVPTQLSWMTEVSVAGWSVARNRELGPHIVSAGSYDKHFIRCGSDGIAYHCPHFMVMGGASLEASTIRPQLHLLGILDQVASVLHGQGMQATPSDKGVYTRETVALFGGVGEVAEALRTADIRLVLNRYLDHGGPGRALGDNRRYLSLTDLNGLLDEERAAALLSQLEPLKVLHRGVILKCRRCRAAAFYGAGDLEPAFRCQRCRLDQTPDRSSWLDTVEPIWYYALSEVIFQFLRHNGQLPFLAAWDRFREAVLPVAYTFELEVVDVGGQRSELDLAVLEGPRLWVGEATVRDRFETSAAVERARLARLAYVAGCLDAYGVILATRAPAFSERTKSYAGTAFSHVWPCLEYREAVVGVM